MLGHQHCFGMLLNVWYKADADHVLAELIRQGVGRAKVGKALARFGFVYQRIVEGHRVMGGPSPSVFLIPKHGVGIHAVDVVKAIDRGAITLAQQHSLGSSAL